MRIQHNIMAMNAYRNYNSNVSAMKSNLEKLSSGYKINRAGDDAAGLAISEKMRAQITGLNAAQKNVKDGISLVQTAEGAMQEVQDMLNRMVYLATQSANGTYDNEVDRNNLQKEVDQLNAEINRIADSANFNGIKLLDGSKDATVKVNETSEFAKYFGGNGPANATTIDDVNKPGHVLTHKEASGSSKTSFSINFTDKEIKLDDTGKFVLTLADKNSLVTGTDKHAGAILVEGKAGETLTGDLIAKAIADAATNGKIELNLGKDNDVKVEYEVTAKDGVVTFNMTDAGFKTAAAKIAEDPTGNTSVFQGNFTWGLWNTTDADGNALGTDSDDFLDSSLAATEVTNLGPKGDNNYGTTVHNVGSVNAGEQLARAGVTLTADDIKDGGGIKAGGTTYVWAMTDKTLNATYGDNTKVIDIRDLCENGKLKDATGSGAGDASPLVRALSRFTEAAKDNSMFHVKYTLGDQDIFFTERADNTSSADLTTFEGVKAQIQKFDSTQTSVKGSALTFQIGDTADSFNQLNVSIGDIHTDALGINGISIANQASAADAVAKIKTAINTVSSIRGDLGATQNRLEHTANNLSVMTENIQDAESSIRDTDVAEEMMSYTKNNILIQAAQAMLAQANQVPQGVLQLLQ